MKVFLLRTVIVVFFPILTWSQDLVYIKLDSSFLFVDEKLEVKEWLEDYECYVFYYESSAWTKDYDAFVIASKGGRWYQFKLEVNYKGERRYDQSVYKVKKQKIRKGNVAIQNIANSFDTSWFRAMNLDSLNSKVLIDENGMSNILMITDASTDVFVIKSSSASYKIWSYATRYYQSKIYMRQRELFWDKRTFFLSKF